MPKTLNIIGCGNVGKVLGRLWTEQGVFQVQDILNRTPESADAAAAFVGAGRPLADYADMRPADVFLIGTPDHQIAACSARITETAVLRAGSIVFHCSGALPSSVLAPAVRNGALAASIHPIKSFADPGQVVRSFAGTFCGVEGDSRALDTLAPAFAAIGARTVTIDPEFKSVYHAAAVFSSNYLVTLLDTAAAAYEKAGIPRDIALQLMEPLVRGTVENVFRLGPTDALTGPIARGDVATVVRQYKAVDAWDRRYGKLYKLMGKLTALIAARKKKKQNT
ncbi:MAG TPA: Rossmann-like and DUF2520 domain-containing protein [Noviherbaspirillum sp.]